MLVGCSLWALIRASLRSARRKRFDISQISVKGRIHGQGSGVGASRRHPLLKVGSIIECFNKSQYGPDGLSMKIKAMIPATNYALLAWVGIFHILVHRKRPER
jgi:hypothetical protein